MTAMTVTSDVRPWALLCLALDYGKGLRDQPRLHNFPLVTVEAPAELGVEPSHTLPVCRWSLYPFLYTGAARGGRPWPAAP